MQHVKELCSHCYIYTFNPQNYHGKVISVISTFYSEVGNFKHMLSYDFHPDIKHMII